MIKKKMNCRICYSNKTKIFEFKHFTFHTKNNTWKNFLCCDCGAVSHFNIYNKKINYKNDYRKHDPLQINLKKEYRNVFPPISSWSSVTFARWRHIWKILKEKTSLFKRKKINMMDYGGYNGYLPYALKQKHNILSWVADFDKNGLAFAKSLGSKTINLNKNYKFKKNFFDLITIVHVLEHAHNPYKLLCKLQKTVSENGLIYIEVPNLYCFPLVDDAHLMAFTHYSLYRLLKKSNLKVLYYGFVQTPKESMSFNYYYNNKKENLYMIVTKTKKKIKEANMPEKILPSGVNNFKKEIQLSYANIMLMQISLNLLKQSARYFKTFINFFLYGLLEFICFKFFQKSLINKYKK